MQLISTLTTYLCLLRYALRTTAHDFSTKCASPTFRTQFCTTINHDQPCSTTVVNFDPSDADCWCFTGMRRWECIDITKEIGTPMIGLALCSWSTVTIFRGEGCTGPSMKINRTNPVAYQKHSLGMFRSVLGPNYMVENINADNCKVVEAYERVFKRKNVNNEEAVTVKRDITIGTVQTHSASKGGSDQKARSTGSTDESGGSVTASASASIMGVSAGVSATLHSRFVNEFRDNTESLNNWSNVRDRQTSSVVTYSNSFTVPAGKTMEVKQLVGRCHNYVLYTDIFVTEMYDRFDNLYYSPISYVNITVLDDSTNQTYIVSKEYSAI